VGQLAVGHGTVEQSGLLTPDLEAAAMNDTTVKKVSSAHSPTGDQGKVYPASGKRVSMRLWRDEEPTLNKPTHRHEYEAVGYVISGRAELEIEGQKVRLEPGDSWVVPPALSTPTAFRRSSRQSKQLLRRPACMGASSPDPLKLRRAICLLGRRSSRWPRAPPPE
jgi:mannose-6-phosphate isomerase-like protein (cupin superfamily)